VASRRLIGLRAARHIVQGYLTGRRLSINHQHGCPHLDVKVQVGMSDADLLHAVVCAV
jgi:hypothetical protein